MVIRKQTAPDPSRWMSSASNAVPTVMRLGRSPTRRGAPGRRAARGPGIGHDPEEQDREDEHARHRRDLRDAGGDIARIGAACPTTTAATIGTKISAASGETRFDRMSASSDKDRQRADECEHDPPRGTPVRCRLRHKMTAAMLSSNYNFLIDRSGFCMAEVVTARRMAQGATCSRKCRRERLHRGASVRGVGARCRSSFDHRRLQWPRRDRAGMQHPHRRSRQGGNAKPGLDHRADGGELRAFVQRRTATSALLIAASVSSRTLLRGAMAMKG